MRNKSNILIALLLLMSVAAFSLPKPSAYIRKIETKGSIDKNKWEVEFILRGKLVKKLRILTIGKGYKTIKLIDIISVYNPKSKIREYKAVIEYFDKTTGVRERVEAALKEPLPF